MLTLQFNDTKETVILLDTISKETICTAQLIFNYENGKDLFGKVFNDSTIFIQTLSTAKNYMNKGYCQKFLKLLFDNFPCQSFALYTDKSNKVALHTYTKVGFKLIRTNTYYHKEGKRFMFFNNN